MAGLKPNEVSDILREELAGQKTDEDLQEVGTVLQVGDGIARIYGLNAVKSGELIEFDNGTQGIVLNLEEDNVGGVRTMWAVCCSVMMRGLLKAPTLSVQTASPLFR
jgi:F-type H+-transporting ATPase subunit alpha